MYDLENTETLQLTRGWAPSICGPYFQRCIVWVEKEPKSIQMPIYKNKIKNIKPLRDLRKILNSKI